MELYKDRGRIQLSDIHLLNLFNYNWVKVEVKGNFPYARWVHQII